MKHNVNFLEYGWPIRYGRDKIFLPGCKNVSLEIECIGNRLFTMRDLVNPCNFWPSMWRQNNLDSLPLNLRHDLVVSLAKSYDDYHDWRGLGSMIGISANELHAWEQPNQRPTATYASELVLQKYHGSVEVLAYLLYKLNRDDLVHKLGYHYGFNLEHMIREGFPNKRPTKYLSLSSYNDEDLLKRRSVPTNMEDIEISQYQPRTTESYNNQCSHSKRVSHEHNVGLDRSLLQANGIDSSTCNTHAELILQPTFPARDMDNEQSDRDLLNYKMQKFYSSKYVNAMEIPSTHGEKVSCNGLDVNTMEVSQTPSNHHTPSMTRTNQEDYVNIGFRSNDNTFPRTAQNPNTSGRVRNNRYSCVSDSCNYASTSRYGTLENKRNERIYVSFTGTEPRRNMEMVYKLVKTLHDNGFNVSSHLNKDCKLADKRDEYIMTKIARADYVLICITEAYRKDLRGITPNGRELTPAQFEYQLVARDVEYQPKKFILVFFDSGIIPQNLDVESIIPHHLKMLESQYQFPSGAKDLMCRISHMDKQVTELASQPKYPSFEKHREK